MLKFAFLLEDYQITSEYLKSFSTISKQESKATAALSHHPGSYLLCSLQRKRWAGKEGKKNKKDVMDIKGHPAEALLEQAIKLPPTES